MIDYSEDRQTRILPIETISPNPFASVELQEKRGAEVSNSGISGVSLEQINAALELDIDEIRSENASFRTEVERLKTKNESLLQALKTARNKYRITTGWDFPICPRCLCRFEDGTGKDMHNNKTGDIEELCGPCAQVAEDCNSHDDLTMYQAMRNEVERLKGILLRGLRELENSHGWDCTHGCNFDCPNYGKCSLQTTLEILRKAVGE